MRTSPALAALVALSGLLFGCDKIQALVSPPAPPAGSAAPGGHGGKVASARAEGPGAHGEHEGGDEYALPFAWETSATEPLGLARSFLKEMYAANGDYATLNQKLFPTYAEKQTPRATVVSCADSRVHTSAFDATPENDDFVIRNIGNQVSNALGSVEYGVAHLNTPVLVILGHTGCGAVKAAMDGTSALEKPIQDELKDLHPPKREGRRSEKDAWVDAVVANVHDQVSFALGKFGRRVHSGRLTIVGTVLDFRNDLGLGAGRMVLVNVNGNRESKRIEAFIEAVTGRRPAEKKEAEDAKSSAKNGSNAELVQAVASLGPAERRAAGAAKDTERPATPSPGHAH